MLYWCAAEKVMLCSGRSPCRLQYGSSVNESTQIMYENKDIFNISCINPQFLQEYVKHKIFSNTFFFELAVFIVLQKQTYLKIPNLFHFENFWIDWSTKLCRITTKLCMKWRCFVEILYEIFQRRLTLQSATGTHVSTAVYWFRYISGICSFLTITMLMESE